VQNGCLFAGAMSSFAQGKTLDLKLTSKVYDRCKFRHVHCNYSFVLFVFRESCSRVEVKLARQRDVDITISGSRHASFKLKILLDRQNEVKLPYFMRVAGVAAGHDKRGLDLVACL